MRFYLYVYEIPTEEKPVSKAYYVYASNREEADEKFRKETGLDPETAFVERQRW